MMMRNSGSILLELIIATAISAMLSIMLFNALAQFNRGIFMTNDIIGRDDRMMLFFKQFERDISGAFVPTIAKKEENKETESQSLGEKSPQMENQAQQKPGPTKKLTIEPLEDAFYAEIENTHLKLLSFVTNNPMVTYTAKPRIARVVYSLEPDSHKKNSYRLMREESGDIFFEPQEQKKSSKKFMLVDGIKEFSLEFVTTIAHSEQGEQPAQPNTPKKAENQTQAAQQTTKSEPQKQEITVKEWPSKELEGKEAALIPDLVIVRLVIWDNRYKRDFVTIYRIPIFATQVQEQQKPSNQPPVPHDNNKKPEPAGNNTGQGGQGKSPIVGTGGK